MSKLAGGKLPRRRWLVNDCLLGIKEADTGQYRLPPPCRPSGQCIEGLQWVVKILS